MGSSSRSRGGPTPGGNDPQMTRRDVLALAALGAIVGVPDTATRGRTGGTARLWRAYLAGADLVRPGRDAIPRHAIHDLLRAARCDAEADAGRADGAQPGGILVGDRRRPELQLRAAGRCHVPQRRAGDRRGREILLRALSRCGEGHAARSGRLGGHRRHTAHHVQAEESLAGLPDVLCRHHRCGLGRAEEVRREGRRRRLQEGADRRRTIQVRLVHAGCGTGAGGLRELLAQSPQRQTTGAEGDTGGGDPARRPEARRDRYRLLDPRRACRRNCGRRRD